MTTFEQLGLAPVILKTLSELSLTTPTPIQEQAIPLVLKGHDVIGLAQTGTGKTAAFGLPAVQLLKDHGKKPWPKTTRALILAPTRELVNQIAVNLRKFVRHTHLKVVTVVGGASINVQVNNLSRGTDILVATPGRLLDLVDRKAVDLAQTRFLVLDEADQMLDLGFIKPLKQIASMVGRPRQTMLFSATMPAEIADLAKAFLTDPVRVEVTPPGKTADLVSQSVHFTGQRQKPDLLKKCLSENPDGLSLVFARTKHGAEKLMKQLVAAGFSAASIHGNKSQNQRERAIAEFRDGKVRVLVATDVAARGIDIPGVTHVYNFDLPEVPESYVHRIGRTARAGRSGEAIAFCGPHEVHLLKAVEKLTGLRVAIASGVAGDGDAGDALPARGRNKPRQPQDGQRKPSGKKPHRKGQRRPQAGEQEARPHHARDGAQRRDEHSGTNGKPAPDRRRAHKQRKKRRFEKVARGPVAALVEATAANGRNG